MSTNQHPTYRGPIEAARKAYPGAVVYATDVLATDGVAVTRYGWCPPGSLLPNGARRIGSVNPYGAFTRTACDDGAER